MAEPTVFFKDALRGTGELIEGSVPEVGFGAPPLAWERQGGTRPVRSPFGFRPEDATQYASIRYNPGGVVDPGIPDAYRLAFKLTLPASGSSLIYLDAVLGHVFDVGTPYGFLIHTEDHRLKFQLWHQRRFNNPSGIFDDDMPHPGAGAYDVEVFVSPSGMVLRFHRDLNDYDDFTFGHPMPAGFRGFMLDISNNARSALADLVIGSAAPPPGPFWAPLLHTIERL